MCFAKEYPEFSDKAMLQKFRTGFLLRALRYKNAVPGILPRTAINSIVTKSGTAPFAGTAPAHPGPKRCGFGSGQESDGAPPILCAAWPGILWV